MTESNQILTQAKEVFEIEAESIQKLSKRIGEEFVQAVETILNSSGRVIVTGMGKSGHVGKKISATLASTGTPAYFLHPAEGIHGDLGMVTKEDVVLAISNSGATPEILNILPAIRRIGAQIIVLSGRRDSVLGREADIFLDIAVEREACPLGLAPTASAIATLAMGDALAVALLTARDFKPEDFALFHPGGSLGKKLLLSVEGVMRSGDEIPLVKPTQTVQEALFIITAKGMGVGVVVNPDKTMQGLLTDGDVRRALEKGRDFLDKAVVEIMTVSPATISKDRLAAYALKLMENHQPRPITVLPVVDAENHILGLVHLTDLLRQGVV